MEIIHDTNDKKKYEQIVVNKEDQDVDKEQICQLEKIYRKNKRNRMSLMWNALTAKNILLF